MKWLYPIDYLCRFQALQTRTLIFAFLAVVAVPVTPVVRAGSSTWGTNPTSGDWNTAGNWAPPTVPNGINDIASFGISSVTEISLSAGTALDSIIFETGANPFSISVSAPEKLHLVGAGVVNDSGVMQTFVTNLDNISNSGVISFSNNATAGNMTVFINNASDQFGDFGGATEFFNDSNAGNATFINNGMPPETSGSGGKTEFHDNSTAANGTFINNPNVFGGGFMEFFDNSDAGFGTFTCYGGMVNAGGGGHVFFDADSSAANGTFLIYGPTAAGGVAGSVVFNDRTSADHATFTAAGGTVNGEEGGVIIFFDTSTAGDATFIVKGATVSGATGGELDFIDDSTAANATIIINGGENGGGGGECGFGDADGGTARIIVLGNGTLTLLPPITIGSIEGSGNVDVFAPTQVGSNNLSTLFSGVMQLFFPLTKIGTGTWKLSGGNTGQGRVTVEEGALMINNQIGSGTGSGPVMVNAGTLGGKGIIAGATAIGTGSGTGAFLEPSFGMGKPATLTIQRGLTFQSDSTYNYKLITRRATADQIVANAITIESGAQFNFTAIGRKRLAPGTVFTAINNTAATSIAGTFANLPDGSTFTVDHNTFQVNYSGGDGNDLTLTVVR